LEKKGVENLGLRRDGKKRTPGLHPDCGVQKTIAVFSFDELIVALLFCTIIGTSGSVREVYTPHKCTCFTSLYTNHPGIMYCLFTKFELEKESRNTEAS
jgi:hypothetical protein